MLTLARGSCTSPIETQSSENAREGKLRINTSEEYRELCILGC